MPWENDRPCGRCLLFGFPKPGDTGGGVPALAFAGAGAGEREVGAMAVLGDDGREADDGSNIFAMRFVSRRKEDGRLLVVGEGVGGDSSPVGEEMKRA